MSLEYLSIENLTVFESFSTALYPSTHVLGHNRSGKSSLKEAIILLFCGIDLAGNRKPTHLIRNGSKRLSIELKTSKATITRTLTEKGTEGLKLIRSDGMPLNLTQSEMDKMIGGVDLFLANAVPGYFMRLSATAQQKVLSVISTPVDRKELAEKLMEAPLPVELDFTKKLSVLQAQVTESRRMIDRSNISLNASIEELSRFAKPLEPTKPAQVDLLPFLETLKKQWSDYEIKLKEYQWAAENERSLVNARYDKIASKKHIESQIALVKQNIRQLMAVPKSYNATECADRVYLVGAKKLALPEKPALAVTASSEHCSTCGQTVAMSHRKKVAETNAAALAEWNKQVSEVEVFNKTIDGEISVIVAEIDALRKQDALVKEQLVKATNNLHTLEGVLATIIIPPEPQILPEPAKPSEMFDQVQYARFTSIKTEYDNALYTYKRYMSDYSIAQGRIKELTAKIDTVHGPSLTKLESVLDSLVEEEIKLQKESLTLPGYELVLNEGQLDITSSKGTPYARFSTGERYKCDVEICKMISKGNKRSMGFLLLDDIDLVDQRPDTTGFQTIIFEVGNNPLTINKE